MKGRCLSCQHSTRWGLRGTGNPAGQGKHISSVCFYCSGVKYSGLGACPGVGVWSTKCGWRLRVTPPEGEAVPSAQVRADITWLAPVGGSLAPVAGLRGAKHTPEVMHVMDTTGAAAQARPGVSGRSSPEPPVPTRPEILAHCGPTPQGRHPPCTQQLGKASPDPRHQGGEQASQQGERGRQTPGRGGSGSAATA